MRRLLREWRLSSITLGAPAYPLLVLLGLNTVDELDRSAFAVLLPDIRNHFALSDAGALGLVSVSTIAVLLIGIPLGFYADRHDRVRIAAAGAALWTLFSLGTGAAATVGMLTVMRVGAGGGRAVVTPTHSSLLADWYPPAARVKVFAAHRLASSFGQIAGPLLAGLGALAFGWRAPFFLFAIPTVVVVMLAMRLREPARGASEPAADIVPSPTAVASMRTLWQLRTIRRLWLATPFLGLALFAVPNVLGLVYDEVYGLDAAQRGAIAAGVEPLQIVGVLVGMPVVARLAAGHPGRLLRLVAALAALDAVLLVALAYAPSLPIAIGVHCLVAGTVATLAPAFMALLSMVAPPHVRSAAFSTLAVFAIPGIAVFLPLIGVVSDVAGIQASLVFLLPITAVGAAVLASAASLIVHDIPAHASGTTVRRQRTMAPSRLRVNGS
jgi:branched-chain amino acid transport system ATP-binding protein